MFRNLPSQIQLSITSALATKCPGTHLQMHWQLKCSGKQSAPANKEHRHAQGTSVFGLPHALTMPESCQIDHRRSNRILPTRMLSLRQCTATEAIRARNVGMCLQTVNATPLTGGLKGAKQRQSSEGHVSSRDKEKQGWWAGDFLTSGLCWNI